MHSVNLTNFWTTEVALLPFALLAYAQDGPICSHSSTFSNTQSAVLLIPVCFMLSNLLGNSSHKIDFEFSILTC